MEDYMEKEEFIKLTTEQIAEIVRKRGKPKVICLIPDGTRKKNIIVDRIDPKSKQFLEYHTTGNHEDFIEILKIFYSHGVQTVFLPTVARGNLIRSTEYQKLLIDKALKTILVSDIWRNFLKEYDIKMKVYGDVKYISELGYPEVMDWISEAENKTKNNHKRKFFLGLAYGQSVEEVRLAQIAIDFFNTTGKTPTCDDLITRYYGEPIDTIDILIRPSVIRDSDMQPILISGKSEFYFPVTSCLQITKTIFREILYDYLYQRMISYGLKDYSDGVSEFELAYMQRFFKLNEYAVLGIGRRMKGGHFWYPVPQVLLPDEKESR